MRTPAHRTPVPRLLAALAAPAALALLVSACDADADGAEPASAADDEPLAVVATFSVLDDLATAVGGEHVTVESIVPVGADPHDYEPTPSDSMALADADLVLDNGLGLNPWFEPLASEVGGDLVIVTEDVADQAVEAATKDEVDPHMWLSPRLTTSYVDAIEDALADLAPEHAEELAANAEALRDELDALGEELREQVETIPAEDRQLVTHEDAFGYFAQDLGFEIVGSAVGPSTEADPSAAGVAGLIDLVEEEDVPAVFPQTTESPDVMERIAQDAGVRLGDPLHVDSVGEPGSDAEDHAGMLRANVAILVEGLTGEEAQP